MELLFLLRVPLTLFQQSAERGSLSAVRDCTSWNPEAFESSKTDLDFHRIRIIKLTRMIITIIAIIIIITSNND